MVGGYDYANSQFDRATEARRQPGSAFKPFVFMAALERGLTPETVRPDAPVRIGKWQPANFNDKYFGDVTLTQALAKSLNSVAVRLVSEVGHKRVIEAAYRLGIESELQKNASIALGTSEVTPLELTAAFVPFANGGFRPFVHFIEKVSTPTGEVLWERRSAGIPRVVSADVVAGMNRMMARTLDEGTARKAAFGWPAAGKTGTTQSSRDVWFVGYTANLTTGVWFGNDDGSPTKNLTGGSLPAIAWHDFMRAAHEGIAMRDLPGADKAPLPAIRDGFPVAQEQTSSIGATEQSASAPPPTRRVDSILDVLLGN
jgi:penicillin-binding protein 1A